MFKINKRLLPIKVHFLCFMAAMGPILPQLSVIGKQIGISPDVMGYITSVLPIMYVLAKPLFGFIADYFSHWRKLIFMSLITFMTLAYGAFYFLPKSQLITSNSWNASLSATDLLPCTNLLLVRKTTCMATFGVRCSDLTGTHFDAHIINASAAIVAHLNLTRNFNRDYHICVENGRLESSDFVGQCELQNVASDCVYGTTTFWLFVVMLCVGTIGFNVTNSISDAICFDMLGETNEHKYGAQRVWGTIGFGFTAMISGVVVDMWTLDAVKSLAPALLIMCVFSGLDLVSVSRLKMPKLSSSESIFSDVWDLVKQPAIATFLFFATMAGIIDSFIIYFMFWHLEEVALETGYMDQIKLIEGLVVAAECLAGEIPIFFYSGKIIKKLGYVHCMSMCFFFYAVRLSLISWIPNPWYLVGVELFLQGATYALCYTCIVAYASAVAPPGTSATVQGLIAGMDDGLGFSIGSLIGGLMFKRYGGRLSFKYFAVAAICTCVLHIIVRPSSRKRLYLPKNVYHVPTEQAAVATDCKQVDLQITT